jgi:hypothetical protein
MKKIAQHPALAVCSVHAMLWRFSSGHRAILKRWRHQGIGPNWVLLEGRVSRARHGPETGLWEMDL